MLTIPAHILCTCGKPLEAKQNNSGHALTIEVEPCSDCKLKMSVDEWMKTGVKQGFLRLTDIVPEGSSRTFHTTSTEASTMRSLSGFTEAALEKQRKALIQREEIIAAFVAKYGCGPDELEQVEQRKTGGTETVWFVRKKEEERPAFLRKIMD
jgi:hypothetical protein